MAVRKTDSPADLLKIRAFIYKSYCEDYRYEDPASYKDKLYALDSWDPISDHYLFEEDGNVVGCCRLVHPSSNMFPCECFCKIDRALSDLERSKSCEISRIIAKKHNEEGLSATSIIFFSLVFACYLYMVECGYRYMLGGMDKRFIALLRRIGLRHEQLGPYTDYHGSRAAWILDLETVNFQEGNLRKYRDLVSNKTT